MNDPAFDSDAFERQLRQFRPAPPSGELMARLENRAAPGAGPSVRPWSALRLLLLGASAAAALVAALAVAFGPSRPPAPTVASAAPPLVYSSSSEAVVAARSEGIYATAGGRPVEVIRLLRLDTSVWRDPLTGNRVEIVRPRQQLLVKDAETY